MKYPRVREILSEYDKAGINGVFKYLNQSDMIIDPSTWAGKIMKDIDEKNIYTAISRIELLEYKFPKKEKDGETNERPGE